MDAIFLRDLRVDALIGIHKRERAAPQTISFDLEIGIANRAVFESDRVADCIDYAKVAARVAEIAKGRHFNLVEVLADHVAAAILQEFDAAWVKVSAAKLGVLREAGRVGVTIERRKP
ncbi:MAG TPA: dihydroneopterin aldolase [Burkholderiales bacterium]|nr:dihydroneopterin aldolase [Burkholderiales bacterium]